MSRTIIIKVHETTNINATCAECDTDLPMLPGAAGLYVSDVMMAICQDCAFATASHLVNLLNLGIAAANWAMIEEFGGEEEFKDREILRGAVKDYADSARNGPGDRVIMTMLSEASSVVPGDGVPPSEHVN